MSGEGLVLEAFNIDVIRGEGDLVKMITYRVVAEHYTVAVEKAVAGEGEVIYEGETTPVIVIGIEAG